MSDFWAKKKKKKLRSIMHNNHLTFSSLARSLFPISSNGSNSENSISRVCVCLEKTQKRNLL